MNSWTLPRAPERGTLGVDPVTHTLTKPPDNFDGLASVRNAGLVYLPELEQQQKPPLKPQIMISVSGLIAI